VRDGHLGQVTPDAMRGALQAHSLPADRFGEGEEVELDDAEAVVVFLDMIEGLYYEADFSREPRRADRYSRRG
jgi:hypothetical protein